MRAVIATNNKNKLREIREILKGTHIEPVSLEEAGIRIEVEETGSTFEENARLKAVTVMRATGMCAIADDSGLSVYALGGAPGVFSARYGGEACRTDADRCALLLSEMEGKADRGAEFCCCVCCAFPDGGMIEAKGTCRGVIHTSPLGEDGFGYDPIFLVPELGRTMAQLGSEEKNRISHRGEALANLRKALRELQ